MINKIKLILEDIKDTVWPCEGSHACDKCIVYNLADEALQLLTAPISIPEAVTISDATEKEINQLNLKD